MTQMYEESEVVDVVLEVVNFIDTYDEQFDFALSEESCLPRSVRSKTREVCREYGCDKDELNLQGSLSSEGLLIETELDDELVVEILQYLEQSDLSSDEALAGLKMRERSRGLGGRPSKVEMWTQKIENGNATINEAKSHMSEPTWYKLKKRVEK